MSKRTILAAPGSLSLRVEMDRGRGWEVRAGGEIPTNTTLARIEGDLRADAIQHPHRALVDGCVVAMVSPGRTGSPDAASAKASE
jgi:hypothetical protein